MSDKQLWPDERILDITSVLREPAREQCQIVATQIRNELQTRIAELERRLTEAGSWEPVEDGVHYNDADMSAVVVRGQNLRTTITDEPSVTVKLREDLRLCRRTVAGQSSNAEGVSDGT
jgi:hypothetical protein